MTGQRVWQGRKLHFVGVGGAGMSGLALIALELGATVSGSDSGQSAVLDELKRRGAHIHHGHSGDNVPEAADLVHTSAVDASNVEVALANSRGQSVLHRSQLLGEMTRLKKTIAVTGTHGKTTTSAMVLRALRGAGIQAGWVIGAGLQEGEPSAGWGSADWLVVEADESDRSLLNLDAEVAVVTNLELDHHATYESFEDLQETVQRFALSSNRLLLADGIGLEGFASIEGAVQVPPEGPLVLDGGSSFNWRGEQVTLQVPGLHNSTNAAVALEAAFAASDDVQGLVSGIEDFRGTSRRFEFKGQTESGARVFDDYAHHPTEVAATIAAAQTMGASRVVAAFQPHLFSRTEELASDFAEALALADVALVADIYPARESQEDFPGVTAESIASLHPEALKAIGGLPDLQRELSNEARAGDLILLMGAGDVGSVAEGLISNDS